jgi:transcriptional regulator with XRE-family HTH domain
MPRRTEPDPLAAAIGRRIRAFREARGLRLEQVAFESGLTSKGHLSDLEHGRVNPTVATLRSVAEQFGVGVVDLVNVEAASLRGRLIERSRDASDEVLARWLAEVDATTAVGAGEAGDAPDIVTSTRAPRGMVPLVDLDESGGVFEGTPAREARRWVRVDARTRALPGVFVAQVRGDGMAPRIAEGVFAVFRRPGPGNRRGRVFLVDVCGSDARERGIRALQFVERVTVRGQARVVLRALNPAHPPRVLDPARTELRILAEFVRVLGG